jgi:hypothetical protein
MPFSPLSASELQPLEGTEPRRSAVPSRNRLRQRLGREVIAQRKRRNPGGADVGGASPVPAQTGVGRAQSRRRCGRLDYKKTSCVNLATLFVRVNRLKLRSLDKTSASAAAQTGDPA